MQPSSAQPGSRDQRTRRALRWPRLGLQGKLVLSFIAVLAMTLGASCWLYSTQGSRRVADIIGDQARQLSFALSLASRSALEARNQHELKRIGLDLLSTHNFLFVAFLDSDGKSVTLAGRDADFEWNTLAATARDTRGLMQVHRHSSAALGEYLMVTTPVLSATMQPPRDGSLPTEPPAKAKLIGYVIVGLSPAREQAMLQSISSLVAVVGAVVVLLCFPLAYALVHRIFLPIRQFVAATNRIAAGNLETQVAIHRPDVIGTLARSFNEMVHTIRAQQAALEAANAQLELANSDLEQKVRERTAQLEAANQRLNLEVAEKEDFLRAVSHDLSAPLRNISGMATMLLMKNREKFDDDVVHRLERIQKNVEVETDLISELLDLSRIKTQRQKMERVDIEALICDLDGVFENDLKQHRIELVLDTAMPVVEGEKARLRQIFQNLIDNAIKYMGDNAERRIHIGCDVKASEVEFYVRDTGLGIEPEDLGKVFNVFRRGKGTQVQGVVGKGVGLATVKSIIETYSGTIWVESTPKLGSTFRFTLNGKYLAAPPAPRRAA